MRTCTRLATSHAVSCRFVSTHRQQAHVRQVHPAISYINQCARFFPAASTRLMGADRWAPWRENLVVVRSCARACVCGTCCRLSARGVDMIWPLCWHLKCTHDSLGTGLRPAWHRISGKCLCVSGPIEPSRLNRSACVREAPIQVGSLGQVCSRAGQVRSASASAPVCVHCQPIGQAQARADSGRPARRATRAQSGQLERVEPG